MIDLSGAQLEPYRALHYFHEGLNVHVKCGTAGAILLANTTAQSDDTRMLGKFIRASDPAWNQPPIHEIDLEIYKNMYGAVGAYAIVALFSAFDDFLNGVEADIARHAGYGGKLPATDAGDEPDEDDRIAKLYWRYGWDIKDIKHLLPALTYFRLMRNCICHRSSRCSKALSEISDKDALKGAFRGLLVRTNPSHPSFDYNQEIFVEPTLAIACSDVLRKICSDCNKKYIDLIGVDSFLRIVAHNLLFRARKVRTDAYKSPEAVLNLALSERYRVPVNDRLEPAQALIRIGIWKEFVREFNAVYRQR